MNKKGTTLVMVVFFGFLFLVVGALTAQDVPDCVMIENQGYAKDRKGPVKLSHKKHAEEYNVACTECHHVYEEGENTWKQGDPVQKCSECHSPLEKIGDVRKLNLAYHKNCKDCHKKAIEAGKEAPYKKCNDCHEKKS